jgi:hypothetical protein
VTYTVHMLAFGKPGEIRLVAVESPADGNELLEEVFHYGQNDYQTQPHPSVSVGYVIELPGPEYWLVRPSGFRRLSDRHRLRPAGQAPEHPRECVSYTMILEQFVILGAISVFGLLCAHIQKRRAACDDVLLGTFIVCLLIAEILTLLKWLSE